MISTTHLRAEQLEQLAALLADTTPGAGIYRPPVGRDVEILRDLEHAGLSRFTVDCGYEITDAGRALVQGHAKDLAHGHAFVMYADDDELLAAIDALKLEATRYLDQDGNTDLRERVLADIEAFQNELDRRADVEGRSETTGRHRLVPVDDRPTEVMPRVQKQTEFEPSSGTLPGLPVVEPAADVLGPDYGEKLLAAIKDDTTPDDVYDELAAEQTAEWDALEADLGDDDRSWLRRKLRPHRAVMLTVLAVVVSVVVTWGVAWWVMG